MVMQNLISLSIKTGEQDSILQRITSVKALLSGLEGCALNSLLL